MSKLTLVALLFATPLLAERYAVLVAIGQYRAGPALDLQGPAYDLDALQRTLVRGHGYMPANMTVLRNESATKTAILGALRGRIAQLGPGDHLLFYFSGHGTSAYDKNLSAVAAHIGPDSGALAPYDLDISSMSAAVDSLLIGRRDLRPLLSRVPSSAQVLVVIDSCYSENAAKKSGLLAAAPSRGVYLPSLVQPNAGKAQAPAAGNANNLSRSEPYPYANVIALAAASRDEPALDISSYLISQGVRTVDGHPHGAFTNALLMALSGDADTNHDGVISYSELHRFIRREMELFPQLPQILLPQEFPLASSALGDGKVLSWESGNHAAAEADPKTVRLRLEDVSAELRARLAKIDGVQLVETGYELMLLQTQHAWELYHSSGTLVRGFQLNESQALAERIAAETEVKELLRWRCPEQKFNVTVDVEATGSSGYDRYRSAYRAGEQLTVRAATDQPAYLLLLNVDKDGVISVLYPGPSPDEQGLQPARRTITISGVKVQPPAGSEYLKIFAFLKKTDDWQQWSCNRTGCPEFKPGDPRLRRLLQMLGSASGPSAEDSVRVVTLE